MSDTATQSQPGLAAWREKEQNLRSMISVCSTDPVFSLSGNLRQWVWYPIPLEGDSLSECTWRVLLMESWLRSALLFRLWGKKPSTDVEPNEATRAMLSQWREMQGIGDNFEKSISSVVMRHGLHKERINNIPLINVANIVYPTSQAADECRSSSGCAFALGVIEKMIVPAHATNPFSPMAVVTWQAFHLGVQLTRQQFVNLYRDDTFKWPG